jgi:hypothetical protein
MVHEVQASHALETGGKDTLRGNVFKIRCYVCQFHGKTKAYDRSGNRLDDILHDVLRNTEPAFRGSGSSGKDGYCRIIKYSFQHSAYHIFGYGCQKIKRAGKDREQK